MKLSKVLSLTTLFTAIIVSLPSLAETWCEGPVTSIGVKKTGLVYTSGPGGLPVVYLCNLQNKVNDVEVESYNTVPSWAYAEHLNWVISY